MKLKMLEHLALDVQSAFSFVVVWTVCLTPLQDEAWVHPGVSSYQGAAWTKP